MRILVCVCVCVQNGGSGCFCGATYGKYGENPDNCTMPCEGDKTELCGNAGTNSVYMANGTWP